jgi:hypothetical protein
MGSWFCIWKNSDNPKNCLYLARTSPTSKTLCEIIKNQRAKNTKEMSTAGHSLLKISTTNSLINHELKCILMTRIINIAGIRDIQFQFQ